MVKKLLLFLLLYSVFALPIHTVSNVLAAAQLKTIKGEATGTFSFQGSFEGSGTLTFTNTGGEAHLTTVCDMSTVDTAAGERCEGINLDGTFSGGPNGIAVFKTATGHELRLPLSDGKEFTFTAQGISMTFTVTDPSIFDEWVETEEPRDSGARVSDLDGQVEIACPPDLEVWDVMKMGRVIYVDCHLKTGENSQAVISFSDMTTFEMKPETEIIIDTPPEKESKWSLLVGNVWVNVKQMVKDGTMKTHMSQAVAGIKGTTFALTETKETSTIKVFEGSVTFTSNTTGKTEMVNAGERLTADKNGLGQKTKFEVSEEEKQWQNKVNNLKKPIGKNIPFIFGGIFVAFVILGLVLRSKARKAKS